jgi:D-inositol-3-phosphate glycosyltransferase
LNILCIGPAYPLRGGIANFNMSLCRAFSSSGHNVSILSFSLQYPGFLFPGKTQYEGGPAPGDIKIHSGINSINPFSWKKSAGFIGEENPDLIILHHWMPFIAVGLASIIRRVRTRTRVPVIAITHNVIPHEKHPFWKVLTARLLKRCDGFITLSSSVLDDLDLFTDSPNKIFVPHPVYEIFGEAVERKVAANKLGFDPAEKYLLFFGYIRKYKGLDLLLRAFAGCMESNPDLKLIVAGEFYSGKQEYLDLITELSLGDRVIIRDEFIPAEEVKYYFSLADLVTQPYLTATQSGVTQIAYHFGIPMLVTDVGGLPEMVPDGKVGYVTPVNANAVAEAITDFFSSDKAVAFRENILEEKKKFSWEAMVSNILELYNLLQ